jgi:hypothetical protein
MITIKQIEKHYQAGSYGKLMAELLSGRVEGSARMRLALSRAMPVAAMSIIRMEELSQNYLPACSKMIRILLAAQDSDGGWGDPMTTALCLRALMCSNGGGASVERGLAYLSNLQKDSHIWPKIPIRRMDADAFTSAFILFQLGDSPAFRAAVRFDEAVEWFERHPTSLDEETAKLWERAKRKCAGARTGELVWS